MRGRRLVQPASLTLVRCAATSNWETYWQGVENAPKYPEARANHPNKKIVMRKTRVEWFHHHGNGPVQGVLGPLRNDPDWEYADGTPAPTTQRRYATKHHQDHLLVQLIRAGAEVEKAAETGELPRIPATKEQRDWDPEIPLFLDDADEHGAIPKDLKSVRQRHIDEAFAPRAPIEKLRAKYSDEPLQANTMFANYAPEEFIEEPILLTDPDRPGLKAWSRRRWNLNAQSIVVKPVFNKNTITDKK